MRIPYLTAAVLLAGLTSVGAGNHRATTNSATYIPPAEPGHIFTVIDFPRVRGTAQATSVHIDFGTQHRDVTVSVPYHCRQTTPAGFVLRIRHRTSDAVPLTLTTEGTFVEGPVQGDLPLEALHDCYRLISGG